VRYEAIPWLVVSFCGVCRYCRPVRIISPPELLRPTLLLYGGVTMVIQTERRVSESPSLGRSMVVGLFVSAA
jgi:hypothetical protein